MVLFPFQWERAQANEVKEAPNFFYFKTDFGRAWQESLPVFRLNQLKVIYLVSSPGLTGNCVCIGSLSFVDSQGFLFPPLRQLLKTTGGSRNKSPSSHQRPSSASGVRSPDENGRMLRVRCKSAQPMNRGQQQVPIQEKKGYTRALYLKLYCSLSQELKIFRIYTKRKVTCAG